MNLYDFYREHYFFEIERKDKLNSSLSLPIGIVALLAGVVSVVVKSVSLPLSANEIILLGLLTCTAFSLVISCFFLIRAYWGHSYKYLPYSKELYEFHKNLTTYYVSSGHPHETADAQSKSELTEHVLVQYTDDATFNAQANNKKSAILFQANRYIVAALVFLVPAIPAYWYQQLTASNPIFNVQLVKESVQMAQQEQQDQRPQPQPQERPSELVKPTAPPSREIKEDVGKPRQK